jgi:hypothetical protein
MTDLRERLRRSRDVITLPDVTYRGTHRRPSKHRVRRAIPAIVMAAVIVAGVGVVLRERGPASPAQAIARVPPAILDGAKLSPGPHTVAIGDLEVTLDIPVGWRGHAAGVVQAERGSNAPSGSGLSFWLVTNVYEDPCRWNSSLADPPVGPSVHDLASALASQRGHPSGERLKALFDGYQATQLQMTVPAKVDATRCWKGEFDSWRSGQGDRVHQGAGQIDQLWIVDVHGTRLVIDAAYFAGTPKHDVQALFAMVRSVNVV